jgi:glycolate oxidase iron-sulfur subunit
MQTSFSPEALRDPDMASSEGVIRKCVHCGFCTATCPTYVLLGDELDSPRGRIYLMKGMLEEQRKPTAEIVKHVDRCLSCLSCMTTCPSGVNYMHLVDHARAYIEETYRRPLGQRLIRWMLAKVLPYPQRFRTALGLARPFKRMAPLFARVAALKPFEAMLKLAPRDRLPAPSNASPAPTKAARGRIAIMRGCAEPVLRPGFREAASRLLGRLGYEIVAAPGEGCCGSLVHHMGRKDEALAFARRNIDAWTAEIARGGLDAIVLTASGCGATLKDYGFMLRNDPAYAEKAARVAALVKDVTEFLSEIDFPPTQLAKPIQVAYHAACSLQHGQKITDMPKRLLAAAGFRVLTPSDSHLCCGSAGVYNILQADIANQLGERKAATLESLDVVLVATGNIGCAIQIGAHAKLPVVHTIELLDWAYGGPAPAALANTHAKVQA